MSRAASGPLLLRCGTRGGIAGAEYGIGGGGAGARTGFDSAGAENGIPVVIRLSLPFSRPFSPALPSM